MADKFGLRSFRELPTLQVKTSRTKGQASGVARWLDGHASATLMDADSAQVTPYEITTALMQAAQDKGAELVLGAAEGVVLEGAGDHDHDHDGPRKRIAGLKVLRQGKRKPEVLKADHYIFCLGPWSPLVGQWLDLDLPMEGIKSSSIILGTAANRRLDAELQTEPYAIFSENDANGCHLEIYPRPGDEGAYVCGLGGSDHVSGARLLPDGDCGSADKVLPDAPRITTALESLRTMAPRMADCAVTTAQACMRPVLPDTLPAIGRVPSVSNGYVNCGHNCWGICWGLISGKLAAELVVSGGAVTSPVDMKPFDPARYMAKRDGRGRHRGAAEVGEQW